MPLWRVTVTSMKTIQYRSVPILDIAEVKQAWSRQSADTIERSFVPKYDRNDIVSHSCRLRLLPLLFHFRRRTLLQDLFAFLVLALVNLALALLYPKALAGLALRLGMVLELPASYGQAWLLSFLVLALVYLLTRLPRYLREASETQLKKDCARKRRLGGKVFDERLFDRRYALVREANWPEFEKSLH